MPTHGACNAYSWVLESCKVKAKAEAHISFSVKKTSLALVSLAFGTTFLGYLNFSVFFS